MNPDRHVYLATAVLAVVLGALVTVITPRAPLAGVMALHSGTDASTRMGPGVGLVLHANEEAADASPPPGVGLRPPAKWLRRDEAASQTDTLRLASAR